ncbi:hypothetical protein KP509_37G038100 [Ceratopteris richardii]|uniref:trans-cinnamate 4-monooxygenase n=1 Tax=Ceratopteris richardii TaxID=49495 RepID=A0A8T2Q841_CERRI|nr:hypothetical protein KP509_37G038100 [Ceratopteris richardii]
MTLKHKHSFAHIIYTQSRISVIHRVSRGLPESLPRKTRESIAMEDVRHLFRRQLHLLSSAPFIVLSLLVLLLLPKLLRRFAANLPPGPLGLPFIGCLYRYAQGITPQTLAYLTSKYGDIFMVKLGQRNVVIVSSPELATEVLHTNGVEFASRTRSLLFNVITGTGQDLVFADYGEHYKNVRKICTPPFFSGKAIQRCREGWEEEITMIVKYIRDVPSASTSGLIIKDYLLLMMYNVVYRMLFSRRFSGLDDPLYMEIMGLNAKSRSLIINPLSRHGEFFPSLKPFMGKFLDQVRDANQQRMDFFRRAFLEELKKQGGATQAAVGCILDAQARGEITEETVLYLIQNINVAGIDTTVAAMEWGIGELVNNSHTQDEILDELDKVVGKGVPLTEPDIARLPYLQAVVKEVLRYHMVIPMLLPHMNLQPAKIGKYDIPAGSKVLINAWRMAMDPNHWEKPDLFDPARFLKTNISMSGNDMRFIPFGSGRRSCPGMAMAVTIMSLTFGRLVQEFRLLPASGDKVELKPIETLFDAHFLAVKSKIILEPRNQ